MLQELSYREMSQFYHSVQHSSSEESKSSKEDSAGSTELNVAPVTSHSQSAVPSTSSSLENSQFSNVSLPSGEESSGNFSFRSEFSSEGAAGGTNMAALSSSSSPVDPTVSGSWREMYYYYEGYKHCQRGVAYAADNNFELAAQEWELAYLFKCYHSVYNLGNCYNQGKGVTKNLSRVF